MVEVMAVIFSRISLESIGESMADIMTEIVAEVGDRAGRCGVR